MSLLLGGDRSQLREALLPTIGRQGFFVCLLPCVDVSASKENRYDDIHI